MTDADKLQAILNLSLTVLSNSRGITPARKEAAINLLMKLSPKGDPDDPDYDWNAEARDECPLWRTL